MTGRSEGCECCFEEEVAMIIQNIDELPPHTRDFSRELGGIE